MRSPPSRGTKMRFEPCLKATVVSSSSCQRRKVISSMTLNRASSLSSMLPETLMYHSSLPQNITFSHIFLIQYCLHHHSTSISSLAAYRAYVHTMPYSNEVGLRMLIGGAAREAAVLGYHITPLFSHYAILVTATNVEILMNILRINLVRLVALVVCQCLAIQKSSHQAWKGLSWGMSVSSLTPYCEAKGVVLCITCAGSGLYVDSILESQGIIVKVHCL
ncbi:hypothetical protein S83_011497, partial [Arachis hypogaea]